MAPPPGASGNWERSCHSERNFCTNYSLSLMRRMVLTVAQTSRAAAGDSA